MAPTRKSFSAKFKAEVLKYITEKAVQTVQLQDILESIKKALEDGKLSQALFMQ